LLFSIPFCLEKSVGCYYFEVCRLVKAESEPLSSVEKFVLCWPKYVTIRILLSPTRIPLTIVMTSVSLSRNPRSQWRQLVHKYGERSHGQNATARAKYESRRRLINATTLHFWNSFTHQRRIMNGCGAGGRCAPLFTRRSRSLSAAFIRFTPPPRDIALCACKLWNWCFFYFGVEQETVLDPADMLQTPR
jgi:hypothetical protein